MDNGIGINEEVKLKLFDFFFIIKDIGKGIGLGLLISYGIIVEKYGGNIFCNLEVGKGIEFVI